MLIIIYAKKRTFIWSKANLKKAWKEFFCSNLGIKLTLTTLLILTMLLEKAGEV